MNSIGAFVLIAGAFYALVQENDWTRFIACIGWAAALVNRDELNRLKAKLASHLNIGPL